MSWRKPQTEEEWSESLSAYLDGELTEEERTQLEICLQSDPDRLQQLQVFQRTSAFLQGWKIEPPEPSAEFQRQFKQTLRENRQSFWWKKTFLRDFFPLHSQWAPFSLGLTTGVFALLIAQYTFLGNPFPGASHSPSGGENQPVYNVFISQNQAETLMGEVNAAGLIAQMKTQLHANQWNEAASTYQTLSNKFPETKAFLELKNLPIVQTFVKKYVKTRSIL